MLCTPGHTPDHACFELREEGSVFTGDCVLGGSSAVFEDLHDYMTSLKNVLAVARGRLYPGHGPVIEDGAEGIRSYIGHREARGGEGRGSAKAGEEVGRTASERACGPGARSEHPSRTSDALTLPSSQAREAQIVAALEQTSWWALELVVRDRGAPSHPASCCPGAGSRHWGLCAASTRGCPGRCASPRRTTSRSTSTRCRGKAGWLAGRGCRCPAGTSASSRCWPAGGAFCE